MVIIVKCDRCKKIIEVVRDVEFYPIRTNQGTQIFCTNCQYYLSEKFHEKYKQLLEKYQTLEMEFKKIRKECRLYKQKRNAELLKHVEVRIKK